jgi:ESF2/ABP1 family protein
MSSKKANELLGVSDSEDENAQEYHSDQEVSKGGRSAKRRKVESDEEADDDFASDQDDDENRGAGGSDYDNDEEEGEEDDDQDDEKDTKKHKTKSKPSDAAPQIPNNLGNPLAKKNLVATEAAIKKSGVVYLSRIPPFMKPIKLRSLLQPYGTINRIFLAPEDPAAHARRVRAGGNKKRSFTEGWVEFTRKRDAKAAAELLNGRTIGGKKGTYYRDDIWNLLYLKGFKWHNLTEQIASENAERTSRMRAEISKTTKENKEFVKNVERSKMLDGMEAKAKAKKKRGHDDDGDGAASERPVKERKRTFTQVAQVKKGQVAEHQQPAEQVSRVLSKIF